MAKYASMKTTMWGVFYVGNAWCVFRKLVAAFDSKDAAEAWAKQHSKDNFSRSMMVEEVKVTIPSWDGSTENLIVA